MSRGATHRFLRRVRSYDVRSWRVVMRTTLTIGDDVLAAAKVVKVVQSARCFQTWPAAP